MVLTTPYLFNDKNRKRELLADEDWNEDVDEDAEVAPAVSERDDDGRPVLGKAVRRRVISPWPHQLTQLLLQHRQRLLHLHLLPQHLAHWTETDTAVTTFCELDRESCEHVL